MSIKYIIKSLVDKGHNADSIKLSAKAKLLDEEYQAAKPEIEAAWSPANQDKFVNNYTKAFVSEGIDPETAESAAKGTLKYIIQNNIKPGPDGKYDIGAHIPALKGKGSGPEKDPALIAKVMSLHEKDKFLLSNKANYDNSGAVIMDIDEAISLLSDEAQIDPTDLNKYFDFNDIKDGIFNGYTTLGLSDKTSFIDAATAVVLKNYGVKKVPIFLSKKNTDKVLGKGSVPDESPKTDSTIQSILDSFLDDAGLGPPVKAKPTNNKYESNQVAYVDPNDFTMEVWEKMSDSFPFGEFYKYKEEELVQFLNNFGLPSDMAYDFVVNLGNEGIYEALMKGGVNTVKQFVDELESASLKKAGLTPTNSSLDNIGDNVEDFDSTADEINYKHYKKVFDGMSKWQLKSSLESELGINFKVAKKAADVLSKDAIAKVLASATSATDTAKELAVLAQKGLIDEMSKLEPTGGLSAELAESTIKKALKDDEFIADTSKFDWKSHPFAKGLSPSESWRIIDPKDRAHLKLKGQAEIDTFDAMHFIRGTRTPLATAITEAKQHPEARLLSDLELASINFYTKVGDEYLNGVLRGYGKERPQIAGYLPKMRDALIRGLNKLPPLEVSAPDSPVLNRYVDMHKRGGGGFVIDDFKVGEVYQDKGFFSSSTKHPFSNRKIKIRVVRLHEGSSGRLMGHLGEFKSEAEVLFPPETKFLVVDIKPGKTYRHVVTIVELE